MPEVVIKKKGWKCNKCSYEWLPKKFDSDKPPAVCPRCGNPRWNWKKRR